MDKKTSQVLRQFPELLVTRTKRHYRITDPISGDFLITSSTPSGCRYEQNLRSDLHRLRIGCGFLERARRKQGL